MKAVFTYTAIGILIVVVLLQIYYMNENYQDASGNVMDGSGNMVTLSLSDLFNAMRFNGSVGMASPSTSASSAASSAASAAASAAQAQAKARAQVPLTTSTQAPASGRWTGSGTWTAPSGSSGSTSATGNMSQLMLDRSTTQPPQPIPGACDAGSGSFSPSSGCGGCSSSGGCSSGNDSMMNDAGAPFNMNEYIRKDSIPCYGCTLP
jgi:hypothetical protein